MHGAMILHIQLVSCSYRLPLHRSLSIRDYKCCTARVCSRLWNNATLSLYHYNHLDVDSACCVTVSLLLEAGIHHRWARLHLTIPVRIDTWYDLVAIDSKICPVLLWSGTHTLSPGAKSWTACCESNTLFWFLFFSSFLAWGVKSLI